MKTIKDMIEVSLTVVVFLWLFVVTLFLGVALPVTLCGYVLSSISK